MSHEHRPDVPEHLTPAEAWEFRYAERAQRWSGEPNATTIDLVRDLTPGAALDLGCGEGADAIWMAQQGWRVTGVDISPTAVARASAAATEAGLTADRIAFVAHDLETWEPDGAYDLVTASFLHSRETFARTAVLRRAAAAVAPGGHLAIVSHGAPPPWSGIAHHDHDLLDAAGEVAALELGDDWEPVIVEHRQRAATGPEGESAILDDVAVLLRRR